MTKLTAETVQTADPRKLVEALRPECQMFGNLAATKQERIFAAALLAVLDECHRHNEANDMAALARNRFTGQEHWQSDNIIRAAAAAWLANGGTLEIE